MFFRWLFGSFVLLPICFTSSTVAQSRPLCLRACKNVQSVSVSDLDRNDVLRANCVKLLSALLRSPTWQRALKSSRPKRHHLSVEVANRYALYILQGSETIRA